MQRRSVGGRYTLLIALRNKQRVKYSSPYESDSQRLFSPAVLIFLLIGVALDAELNQTVDQIGVVQSRCAPQLGIHADGSESRHGVDFVQINFSVLPRLHQEVDAGEAGAVNRLERLHGKFLKLLCFSFA